MEKSPRREEEEERNEKRMSWREDVVSLLWLDFNLQKRICMSKRAAEPKVTEC